MKSRKIAIGVIGLFIFVFCCLGFLIYQDGRELKEVYSETKINLKTTKHTIAAQKTGEDNYCGHINDEAYFINTASEKFVLYSLNNNHETIIYQRENIPSAYQLFLLQNTLVLMTADGDTEQGGYHIQIKAIAEDTATILFEEHCSNIPYIYNTGSKLLLNYDQKPSGSYLITVGEYQSTLALLDIISHEMEIIDTAVFFNQDGNLIGQTAIYGGGNKDCIYYQEVKLNGTPLEMASIIRIMKYDTKTQQIQPISKPFDLSVHIAGNNDHYIASYYDYTKPLNDSGRLYADGIEYSIPQITSGNDIMHSRFNGEKSAVLLSAHHCYFYNFKAKKYFYQSFESLGERISEVVLADDEISYIEYAPTGEAVLVIKSL